MDFNNPGHFAPPSGTTEFDYGAFLREDAIDYFDDEASGSSATMSNSPVGYGSSAITVGSSSSASVLPSTAFDVSADSSSNSAGANVSTGTSSGTEVVQANTPTARQRLERRGHTKSRRGCFNCKRRRIKYEFLMHAILGFSASDLVKTDKSLLPFAMTHRLKAIRAIKKRLAEVARSSDVASDECNAMVATCFALTFQSVLLDDGMAEFMTFVRGVLIVGIQMWMKGVNPMFRNLMNDDAEKVLEPFMEHLPLVQSEWVDGAYAAIQTLRSLCRDQVEIEYHDLLVEWVQQLYVSSFEAYKTLRRHYSWWMVLPHDRFRRIIDPDNQVMLLLSSHWIALKQIMAFITEAESQARVMQPSPPAGSGRAGAEEIDPGMFRWLRYLNRQISGEYRIYNTWPVWVEKQMSQDLTFFGKTR